MAWVAARWVAHLGAPAQLDDVDPIETLHQLRVLGPQGADLVPDPLLRAGEKRARVRVGNQIAFIAGLRVLQAQRFVENPLDVQAQGQAQVGHAAQDGARAGAAIADVPQSLLAVADRVHQPGLCRPVQSLQRFLSGSSLSDMENHRTQQEKVELQIAMVSVVGNPSAIFPKQ